MGEVRRVLFVGGITGGHLTPIKSIKTALDLREKSIQYFLITNKVINKGQNQIIKDINAETFYISVGKLRRSFSLQNIFDFFKTFLGMVQSIGILFKVMPNVVFSRGSSVSVPVCIVAWIFRIPVIIHESDITPSLTNKILKRFAKKICISFKETEKFFPSKKTILTGVPLRQEIYTGNKNDAIQYWKLKSNLPIIFITGGSQGSRQMNTLIINSLPKLLDKYQIILQCGLKLVEETKKSLALLNLKDELLNNFRMEGFISGKTMYDTISLSDIVLTRGGMTALMELATLKKAFIVIPLINKVTRGDQVENAKYFTKRQAALLLGRNNMFPSFLRKIFSEFLDTPEGRKNLEIMAQNAFNSIYKNADEEISKIIINFL